MRLSTDPSLPTDSRPPIDSTAKQLIDQKAGLLACLEITRRADQNLKKYMAKRCCFALLYTNGSAGTDWCPPPDFEKYEGMVWQQNDRWSCFVLIHYEAPIEKEVPQAIIWEGITPIVVVSEGVALENERAFEKEWSRFFERPEPVMAVRYFRQGDHKMRHRSTELQEYEG